MHPKTAPGLWAYALNAVLGLVVAFHVFSASNAHYVTTIATAVVGLIVTFTHASAGKPVNVPAAATLFTTILTGLAGFGLHLGDAKIAAITTVFSMLAAFFTHQSFVHAAPAPAGRK